MREKFEIDGKIINLIYNENTEEGLPVIVLNTFDEDGQEIWDKSQELNSKEYILVTISNIDWNKEMSPWYMDKLFKAEEDYSGKADEYIWLLTSKIVPEIRTQVEKRFHKKISKFIIAGYSLAGLFAVYCLYKTNLFHQAISCSGSLWYPNFLDFAKENVFLGKPEKIYFSLGNKESKTRNELMAKVEENTKTLEQFYKMQGIQTIYEENEGNHFQDVSLRLAKGIYWSLKEEEIYYGSY